VLEAVLADPRAIEPDMVVGGGDAFRSPSPARRSLAWRR
jgi:DNA repair exonuclease SbcCD nuclease subunit